MTDKELHAYVLDWIEWCRTRRFYMTAPAKNTLARLQPAPVGKVPDGRNFPEMQFFNSAVRLLATMPEYATEYACFQFHYLEGRRHIKKKAADLNICRQTYYNYVSAFTRRAVAMGHSLKSAHAAMMAHGELAVATDECVD